VSDKNNDYMKPDGEVNPIDTDYTIGQDNIVMNVGPFGLDIHNRVFGVSALMIVVFVFLTMIFQEQAEPMFSSLRGWLTSNLDWFFLTAAISLWWFAWALRCHRWARCALAALRPSQTIRTWAGSRCCLPLAWALA